MVSNYMLIFVSLCASGYAVQRDYPWTVKLGVSDAEGSDFEGPIELAVVFSDKRQHWTQLPSTKYERGQTYTFPIHLLSDGSAETVYIRTQGECALGNIPNDVLRISGIELDSISNGLMYSKSLSDLAVKDACQKEHKAMTQIMIESKTVISNQQCQLYTGKSIPDGQDFEMGCLGKCKCENGSISCIDMCPPYINEDPKCNHNVLVPGQCCERLVCEDQANICAEPTIANVDDGRGNMTVAVRRYPWSVLFCADEQCKELHGGVIIGQKHMLTFAPDLSYLKELRVASGEYIVDQLDLSNFTIKHISNVSANPDFVNPNSPIADSSSRLQVIQFNESFEFSRILQAANLPFDANHCKSLSKTDCPLTTVGWDRTDDSDDTIRQWFLHADRSRQDSNLCQSNATSTIHPKFPTPRRRGEKRLCIGGLVRDDCTGPMGGTIVSSAATVDFVVGVTDPDSALFFCNHAGTADMLSICKYVDWIKSLISS